jgi:hypothetical protein
MSAYPCGCDPEANHQCGYHEKCGLAGATDTYPVPGKFPSAAQLQGNNNQKYLGKAETRKTYPVASGVLDYFPLAIMEVAHVSWAGNQQHYPADAPLHWDRSKSSDEADALLRHFIQRGTKDTDGVRHTAKVAWRALALLQKELEQEGK